MLDSHGDRQNPGGWVVVVEDDPLIRLDIAAELRSSGYAVTDFETADEALDLLADTAADVCALVTDISTPGRHDGLDLADRMFAQKPVISVVFTTGTPQKIDPRTRRNPRERVIAKPYAPPEVLAHLRALDIVPTPADHT